LKALNKTISKSLKFQRFKRLQKQKQYSSVLAHGDLIFFLQMPIWQNNNPS
jgi:hypothetical protein